MSRYIRPKIDGATIFFTVCLARRGSDLLVRYLPLLREAVRATRAERPFEIDAFVVLPDHLHCIWTLPPGDHDFSARWGAIKARFTRNLRRAGFTPPIARPVVPSGRYGGVNPALRHDRGEVALWQRRFWEHHIRNDADLAVHIRYCWTNPVKHGLVATPADWPYSSIHRDIRLGRVEPEWLAPCPDGVYGEREG
ncbi:REP-associated tyrosine transposase [Pseudoroseicyclus aestuarii]|uniref:Putative transposase n=1 Tax=Pseudoroseicyclus aestuarii TaxID=1795041 RepID=A0A318TAS8_9RHOB|nr:transposase [Pseudoroseicyclus aestuarii]PYE85418.1 putative transposase [Pseudoroseicyclus aestuarii]